MFEVLTSIFSFSMVTFELNPIALKQQIIIANIAIIDTIVKDFIESLVTAQ